MSWHHARLQPEMTLALLSDRKGVVWPSHQVLPLQELE